MGAGPGSTPLCGPRGLLPRQRLPARDCAAGQHQRGTPARRQGTASAAQRAAHLMFSCRSSALKPRLLFSPCLMLSPAAQEGGGRAQGCRRPCWVFPLAQRRPPPAAPAAASTGPAAARAGRRRAAPPTVQQDRQLALRAQRVLQRARHCALAAAAEAGEPEDAALRGAGWGAQGGARPPAEAPRWGGRRRCGGALPLPGGGRRGRRRRRGGAGGAPGARSRGGSLAGARAPARLPTFCCSKHSFCNLGTPPSCHLMFVDMPTS